MIYRSFIVAAVIIAAAFSVSAQRVPRFSQYAAKVERHARVTVNLKSHKDARMFRTNLRNAAKGGVNFAGHYILTGWGCGTNCSSWAIIDARNGKVFFPKQFGGVGGGLCDLPNNSLPADAPKQDEAEYPDAVVFKPNSRMVMINGYTGGDLEREDAKCGSYYFEWNGSTLRQIKFIAGKSTMMP